MRYGRESSKGRRQERERHALFRRQARRHIRSDHGAWRRQSEEGREEMR